MLGGIASIADARAVDNSAMTVAVDRFTISTGPGWIAHAVAVYIVAVIAARELFATFSHVSFVAMAYTMNAFATERALFEALGPLAISALVALVAFAFATHVASVVGASKSLARSTSKAGCAFASAIVALALARAVVGAGFLGAVVAGPSLVAIALSIAALTMARTACGATQHFALGSLPWRNTIACTALTRAVIAAT